MSVIAWDGKTLAADKRASLGTLIRTTTKIARCKHGALAGYSGAAAAGEELLAWVNDGGHAADFPAARRNPQAEFALLLLVWQSGELWLYENTPYPMKFPPQQFAIGSGRDFALAAMHLGRSASDAVGVACQFDSGCGNGVDTLTF